VARWKSTLVASWLAQICSIIGFGLVGPFLPFFIRELGVHDERAVVLWAGWGLGTSAGLTMAIFAPLWGVLADRHGRKLMVARSMFGGALVLGLMSQVQNVYQLLGLRVFQGMLTGTVSASVALVSSVVPKRHSGFALGLMQSALFVGSSVGPWVGGAIAQQEGYRIPFYFAAGFVFLGGLMTVFIVRENFVPPDRATRPEEAGTLLQVLTLTGFGTMIILLFMVQFAGSFIGPILPLYIEKLSHLPEGRAAELTGRIFGLGGVAAAIAATILGRMSDRIGHGRVLITCTFLTGLMLIPHGLAQTVNQLLFWRLCTAVVEAGTIPAANALIRHIIPDHACGKAYGLVQSICCLGWALGPGLGSSLAAQWGMRVPFFVVGGTFIMISCVAARVLPKMQREINVRSLAEQEAMDGEGCVQVFEP
jgi:MFS transporter, DHA1 family, multidrug resistance protein